MLSRLKVVSYACAFVLLFSHLTMAAKVTDALTLDNLQKFSPHARADLIAGLIQYRSYLEKKNINNPQRFYHFIAEVAAETGGLLRLDENMNYSEQGLLKIFPKSVSPDQARRLAHRPVAIANHVYGKKLGNLGRSTNDGWDYRGSGYIQLTGRANFRDRGKDAGLKLEGLPAPGTEDGNPELARSPNEGLLVATEYWNSHDINSVADHGSVRDVRLKINPALVGLDNAKIWYIRAKKAFGPDLEGPAQVAAATQLNDEERLAAMSALEALDLTDEQDVLAVQTAAEPGAQPKQEADAAAAYAGALREFQRDRGLPETGTLDDDTLYELTDPKNVPRE
ncbi:peptidoglycan-binding protein [Mesorhizobium sp. WSM3860]|uniref:glycoside hydrolase family 19 protein n=1 Tax=Mesorhizobium sp. WSM3860 TaxID=2029403 RepID=UPI000BAF993A|nr:peptidoglycan-binding protein [Mesorhizobium sp. WSM3860]